MLNKELPSRWYEALTLCQQQGVTHVLATIIAVSGSAPRELQAKMVITNDACSDTLGGGGLEYEVIAHARRLMDSSNVASLEQTVSKQTVSDKKASAEYTTNITKTTQKGQRRAVLTKHYPLGAALGQCCGGSVTVMFECFYQTPVLSLLVFGAGHVARSLMTICAQMACQVDWVDSRSDVFDDLQLPAHIHCHISDDPSEFIASHAQGRYVIIMTHDHGLDFELVRHALVFQSNNSIQNHAKDLPISYIGCIGSKTKAMRFRSRLRQRGFDDKAIDQLIMPVGLDIGGKQPMAVAVSIMAQVLAHYHHC